MIKYMTGTGAIVEGKPITSKELTNALVKLGPVDAYAIEVFLLCDIPYKPFSITTKYPGDWPIELSPIWSLFDEALSREFLGRFVWNLLANDNRIWFATKSKLPTHAARPYESMFYAPHN